MPKISHCNWKLSDRVDFLREREADEAEARRIFESLEADESNLTIIYDEAWSLNLSCVLPDRWAVTITDWGAEVYWRGTIFSAMAAELIAAAYRPDGLAQAVTGGLASWRRDPFPDSFLGSTTFHLGRHWVEDGKLRIPAGGCGESGVWDGHIVVESTHPNYELWRWIIAKGYRGEEDSWLTSEGLEVMRVVFEEERQGSRPSDLK